MNIPNPYAPDAPKASFTCPICAVEFPSFATWSRNDRDHYLQSRRPVWDRHTATAAEYVETNEYDNVEGPERRPSTGRQTARTATPGGNKATEKQVEFLSRLMTERGVIVDDSIRAEIVKMTKRQASDAIDAFMKTPKVETQTTTTTTTVRRNKFEGRCATCRQTVAENAGILTQENGKWIVRHDGDCPVVETQTTTTVDVDVPDGYYAIESTGRNDLAFYRVTHSDRYGISVKTVVGGHPEMWVRRNALAGIVERIAADVAGAAKRYADEIGSCYICNRELTDEESRRLGIGPVCRNKS